MSATAIDAIELCEEVLEYYEKGVWKKSQLKKFLERAKRIAKEAK